MFLFFASNAIYPVSVMPAWLKVLARGNPLSYEADALRGLMVQGGSSAFGLGVNLAVMAGVMALLVAIASRLYPRVVA
jgi:ABC-2 type transport system permease protein